MSTGIGAAMGTFGRATLVALDQTVTAHAHPHAHFLFNVGGAPTSFCVDCATYPLDRGTGVFVNTWEAHAYPHRQGAPSSMLLGLYIEPEWLARLDPRFAMAPRHDKLFQTPSFPLNPAMRVLVAAVTECLSAKSPTPSDVEDLVARLAIEALHAHGRRRQHHALAEYRAPLEAGDYRIRRATQFMRENIVCRFTYDEVARVSGLSRSHLFEQFRRQTGLTPNLVRGVLRMEAAYLGLRDGRPIAVLADRLGFAAPGHFTRFFKSNLGVTPREYRRLLLNGYHAEPIAIH